MEDDDTADHFVAISERENTQADGHGLSTLGGDDGGLAAPIRPLGEAPGERVVGRGGAVGIGETQDAGERSRGRA